MNLLGLFCLESGFLRNFEKFLKNPVTFLAELRLYIVGTAVIGRSCEAALVLALVLAESEAAAGKAGQAGARSEGNQPASPRQRQAVAGK